MKLYLVRHGEACDPEVNAKRPLTEVGKQRVQQIANFLANAGINFSQIYHSGKLRAQQTAEILGKTVAPASSIEILPSLDLPNITDMLLEEINLLNEDTLFVGHIPLLPKLAAKLLVNDSDKLLIDFHPASVLCLQQITQGNWLIDWMLSADLFNRR